MVRKNVFVTTGGGKKQFHKYKGSLGKITQGPDENNNLAIITSLKLYKWSTFSETKYAESIYGKVDR